MVAGGGQKALIWRDAKAVDLRIGVWDCPRTNAAECFPKSDDQNVSKSSPSHTNGRSFSMAILFNGSPLYKGTLGCIFKESGDRQYSARYPQKSNTNRQTSNRGGTILWRKFLCCQETEDRENRKC